MKAIIWFRFNAFPNAISDRVRIVKPLRNEDVLESETVALSVTISKPCQVAFWYKNEEHIVDGDRFKIRVDDHGLQHSLTVENVSAVDVGKYLVRLDDGAGGIRSASWTVSVRKFTSGAVNDSRMFEVNFIHSSVRDNITSGFTDKSQKVAYLWLYSFVS